MTTVRASLLALAEKVESLTGLDTEVDREIVTALSLAPANYVHYERDQWLPDFMHGARVLDLPEWRQPALTGSVDAVLALIAERLPTARHGYGIIDCGYSAFVARRLGADGENQVFIRERGESDLLAPALLAALLRALASQAMT